MLPAWCFVCPIWRTLYWLVACYLYGMRVVLRLTTGTLWQSFIYCVIGWLNPGESQPPNRNVPNWKCSLVASTHHPHPSLTSFPRICSKKEIKEISNRNFKRGEDWGRNKRGRVNERTTMLHLIRWRSLCMKQTRAENICYFALLVSSF